MRSFMQRPRRACTSTCAQMQFWNLGQQNMDIFCAYHRHYSGGCIVSCGPVQKQGLPRPRAGDFKPGPCLAHHLHGEFCPLTRLEVCNINQISCQNPEFRFVKKSLQNFFSGLDLCFWSGATRTASSFGSFSIGFCLGLR